MSVTHAGLRSWAKGLYPLEARQSSCSSAPATAGSPTPAIPGSSHATSPAGSGSTTRPSTTTPCAPCPAASSASFGSLPPSPAAHRSAFPPTYPASTAA